MNKFYIFFENIVISWLQVVLLSLLMYNNYMFLRIVGQIIKQNGFFFTEIIVITK